MTELHQKIMQESLENIAKVFGDKNPLICADYSIKFVPQHHTPKTKIIVEFEVYKKMGIEYETES